jgi:hypothetical protein
MKVKGGCFGGNKYGGGMKEKREGDRTMNVIKVHISYTCMKTAY